MGKLWAGMGLTVALLISTPVIVVMASLFFDSGGVWQHLAETVLLRPESMVLHEAARVGSVPGRVGGSRLRGENSDIEVQLASGEAIVTAVSSYAGWKPGMTAHVSILPNAAIVLPAESGPPGRAQSQAANQVANVRTE